MSKRLQSLLDEEEFREIQRVAGGKHLTVAEWVRQALRAATCRRTLDSQGGSRKLGVIRAAASHAFPAGTVEEMLAAIE